HEAGGVEAEHVGARRRGEERGGAGGRGVVLALAIGAALLVGGDDRAGAHVEDDGAAGAQVGGDPRRVVEPHVGDDPGALLRAERGGERLRGGRARAGGISAGGGADLRRGAVAVG